MDMTRTSFLIAAALVVSLVVAAAGMGAYVAVRWNAAAPSPAGEPPPESGTTATLHGIDPQVVAGEPVTGSGIAVASTEQVLGPAVAAGTARPTVEAPRTDRPRTSPPRQTATPRRAAARSPAPAPRAPAPPRRPLPPPARPAPAEAAAPAPQPASATPAEEPGPGRASEPGTVEPSANRPPARASRELPEIVGWEPAEPVPSTAFPDRPVREEAAARDLPRPASASLDPPNPAARAEPPLPATEGLLIPVDSVIGLQIDTFVTTDRAAVEDDVQARVTRDVVVSRRVAIPAGSLVNGSVVMVERGGKLQGGARLGVRFHTVVLDDGIEVPIMTETVYREGRSRGRDNAARIGGGAVAGAILGAIFGGGRGAAIGGAAGAAGGTAAAAAGDAEPATLPAGTTLTVRLSRPAQVTVER